MFNTQSDVTFEELSSTILNDGNLVNNGDSR